MQPCQTGQKEGYMLFQNANGEAAKLAVLGVHLPKRLVVNLDTSQSFMRNRDLEG